MIPPSATQTSASPAKPEPVEVITPARTEEHRALGFLALVALAALVRLALPVGVGLFLGALLAFALEPIYGWFRRKEVKAGMAALVCAVGATAFVSSTVLAMTTLIVTRGIALLEVLREQLGPGGSARVFAENTMTRLTALHVNVADLSQRLESEMVSLGERAAAITAQVAGLTFGGLLTLFFMTLAAYFVLRHWNDIVLRSERMLPFERRHTHDLLGQFRSVGREVLLGTVVTGVVQGLLAAIGYWVTGVAEPAFFGALTALASLVPGVGALLVWVPIGVVQIVAGRPGAGLVELIYSALTVGIASDYFIRPRLLGREKGIPSIFMFIALFGGVSVFGIIGLILGPVTVTLSLAILRTYERGMTERAPM
jgi:predicted PurR-regulated permease PerM